MATNEIVAKEAPTEQQRSQAGVPKRFFEGQTVCNEKNEKGKLCNGHLKQISPIREAARKHLRGDDLLYKCQTCGALYAGPPLGHVRDPRQRRYVEHEQNLILQAAGGTLPAIQKNERGVYVLAEPAAAHAPAPAKPAAAAPATPKPAAPPQAATASKPAAPTATAAAPVPDPDTGFLPYIPPPAPGPVAGETQAQKLARLQAIVAEAKRRKELAGGIMPKHDAGARTTPTAATTSGTDSSPAADVHRPAAEAQAATGQASAVPLSPAAATASPAAGAATVADLALDASTELTPGAPKAAAPAATSAKPKARTATGTITRMDYDTGPVPGETHDQMIARLRAVVAEAKRRAGKE